MNFLLQFALVRYGTLDSDVLWDLSSAHTDTLMTLQEAINSVEYSPMMRNTASGLHVAATSIFSGASGDR